MIAFELSYSNHISDEEALYKLIDFLNWQVSEEIQFRRFKKSIWQNVLSWALFMMEYSYNLFVIALDGIPLKAL